MAIPNQKVGTCSSLVLHRFEFQHCHKIIIKTSTDGICGFADDDLNHIIILKFPQQFPRCVNALIACNIFDYISKVLSREIHTREMSRVKYMRNRSVFTRES